MASQAARKVVPKASRKYLIWSASAVTGGAIIYAWWRWHQQQYRHPLYADSPRSFVSETGKVEIIDNNEHHPAPSGFQTGGASSYLPDWSAIGDKIKDAVVPDWAQDLPEYATKLQHQLSDEEGSLAQEIWRDAHNPNIHPEIRHEALVRVADELCSEERHYLCQRKHHVRSAVARYLHIAESDIHPDDVPVIGMCGSGGGLRAMVAGASSFNSAQESGLFDCVTYTAGVSGSCWLQSLYHSSLTKQNFGRLLDHLRSRISTHIAFPPSVLKLITHAPTHKYLLAGGLEKWKGIEDAEFGIVDVYGLLLGARLMVPQDELDVEPANLKLSEQRKYIDQGHHPMPIYTAVRHEIPSKETADEDNQDDSIKEQAKKEAWFQWFEFTPYELWCEEFAAGIPTWAIGRTFENGRSRHKPDGGYMPEIRIPLLQGIWGSAFCATLSHYYKEIQPLVQGLTGFGKIDKMLGDYNEDLVKMHPVSPSQIPNYALGMRDRLPDRCPDSVHQSPHIQLMDAGMSNNLPIYPLLRPGREVDIIVAFDASADIKTDNWLRVADGYARQRGIKGWPVGVGWPEGDEVGPDRTGNALDEMDNLSPQKAHEKLSEAKHGQEQKTEGAQASRQNGGQREDRPNNTPTKTEQAKKNLGYCTVWVGTTEERSSDEEPPQSKAVDNDWELMHPNAGIAVIYFPFMANAEVEGVDPEKSDFLSTWNFIYTPENIDKVVQLARANFDAGEEKMKKTIRAVYERKKRLRLMREGRSQGK